MINKDEAVQKLATVGHLSMAHAEDLYDSIIPKPVVPKYVADWLKENDWREDTSGRQTIFDAFDNLTLDASNGFYVDVKKWVEENGNIFAQAWAFGYEVEKEPRYTVEFKGIDDNYKFLNYGTSFKDWTFDDGKGAKGVRVAHTRKELESNGFGWVFSCEGVEVKEVDDGND